MRLFCLFSNTRTSPRALHLSDAPINKHHRNTMLNSGFVRLFSSESIQFFADFFFFFVLFSSFLSGLIKKVIVKTQTDFFFSLESNIQKIQGRMLHEGIHIMPVF